VQGQALKTLAAGRFQAKEHLLSFDLSEFTAGLYFLSINTKGGQQQYKLIIQ